MLLSRRIFLQYSVLAAGASLLPSRRLFAGSAKDVHREILKAKFALATAEDLHAKPIGDVVAAIGVSFLGTPYKPHTLEVPGPERLVVNLQAFDCVTFVESVLAIARCTKLGSTTYEGFTKQLQFIRYRDGVIDGYPSRLHYFSDWIDNNEAKRVVRNVAPTLGGIPFEKTITYMSAHRSAYRQLKDASVYDAIVKTERDLNARKRFYLPKERMHAVEDQIRDGDVIGITTSMEGLDVTHTGFAYRSQGELRFLHAPLSAGTVQITKHALADYLDREQSRTGIMIARPLEPNT
jgi:hypothetical protein